MEDKIEVGEHIRTTYGGIYKIEDEEESDVLRDMFYGNITKHSKNIIDLIEVRRLCEWRKNN